MKVGRFGLGFKSVFHMTGKVNTFRVRERFSLLITISGPEKAKKITTNHPPLQRSRETTWARRQCDEVVVCATYSRLKKLSCQIN